MLCGLCKGSGNFFCTQDGAREWWTCPACGGAGVRIMYGPAVIVFTLSGGQRKALGSKPIKQLANQGVS